MGRNRGENDSEKRERKKIGREKRKNDSGKRERKILKTDLEKVGQ